MLEEMVRLLTILTPGPCPIQTHQGPVRTHHNHTRHTRHTTILLPHHGIPRTAVAGTTARPLVLRPLAGDRYLHLHGAHLRPLGNHHNPGTRLLPLQAGARPQRDRGIHQERHLLNPSNTRLLTLSPGFHSLPTPARLHLPITIGEPHRLGMMARKTGHQGQTHTPVHHLIGARL